MVGYGPGCPLSIACCVIAPRIHHPPFARFTGFSLDRKFNVSQVDGDTVLPGLGRLDINFDSDSDPERNCPYAENPTFKGNISPSTWGFELR